MMLFVRLFFESFRFAFQALKENPLRTLLSLLGVTVGIFAIIAVLTIVDTLDNSIRKSLSFLGNNVIYVQKFPFAFNEPNYPWWKYLKRPQPTYDEYKFLHENLTWASGVSVFDVKGRQVIKYENNSIGDVAIMGASHDHNKVSDIDINIGRYFSYQESDKGRNVAIIGANIAESLFPNADPIGKQIKIKGLKFNVIGIMKKQGDNLLPTPSNDNLCIVPYMSFAKLFSSSSRGINPVISVRGFQDDTDLQEVLNEMRGLLRAKRGLKPKQEDDFALNRTEAIAVFINGVIKVLKIAGWIIGSFSMLVGGFGIANIMFVSVKERTNLIGIQKSLGAKNYFILFQFLFEAMFLSFFGGILGLVLVSGLSLLSTDTFVITLSVSNIALGLIVASIIGVLSGIIPAISASRLDPVIAIRSK